MHAAAACRTELVCAPLTGGGNFGHHAHFNVGQCIVLTALWRNTSQYPCRALVIHDAARAIDRINDALECSVFDFGAQREAKRVRIFQSFHDDLHRPLGRPVVLKPIKNRLICNAINCVDYIRRCLFGDCCELVGGAVRTFIENGFQCCPLQRT